MAKETNKKELEQLKKVPINIETWLCNRKFGLNPYMDWHESAILEHIKTLENGKASNIRD
jgi:hypothetical protein